MRKIAMLLALLLIACETKEHAEAELGALDKAKKAASAASAHAGAAQSEEIGIPACDKYARAMQGCISEHIAEGDRADLQKTFDEQTTKWRNEVILRHPLEPVEAECRNAMADAMRTYSQNGCVF
jgi:hypothetical protein